MTRRRACADERRDLRLQVRELALRRLYGERGRALRPRLSYRGSDPGRVDLLRRLDEVHRGGDLAAKQTRAAKRGVGEAHRARPLVVRPRGVLQEPSPRARPARAWWWRRGAWPSRRPRPRRAGTDPSGNRACAPGPSPALRSGSRASASTSARAASRSLGSLSHHSARVASSTSASNAESASTFECSPRRWSRHDDDENGASDAPDRERRRLLRAGERVEVAAQRALLHLLARALERARPGDVRAARAPSSAARRRSARATAGRGTARTPSPPPSDAPSARRR